MTPRHQPAGGRYQQGPPDYSTLSSTIASSTSKSPTARVSSPSTVVAVEKTSSSTPAASADFGSAQPTTPTTAPPTTAAAAAPQRDSSSSAPAANNSPSFTTPSPRARRPSSLPYSLRPAHLAVTGGKIPTRTKRLAVKTAIAFADNEPCPSQVVVKRPQASEQRATEERAAEEPQKATVAAAAVASARVVAPTATPEDSFVEGPSSSEPTSSTAGYDRRPPLVSAEPSADMPFLTSDVVRHLASPEADVLLPPSPSSSSNRQCLPVVVAASHSSPNAVVVSSSSPTSSTKVAAEMSVPTLPNGRAHRMVDSSSTGNVAASVAGGVPTNVRGRFQKVFSGARHRLFGRHHRRTSEPSKTNAAVTTAVDDTSSWTEQSAVARVPELHPERPEVETTPTAGPLTSPDTADVDDSPSANPSSYHFRHARFSHVGSHALDVFYSPDDDDADDFDGDERSTAAPFRDVRDVPNDAEDVRAGTTRPSWRPLIGAISHVTGATAAVTCSRNNSSATLVELVEVDESPTTEEQDRRLAEMCDRYDTVRCFCLIL